MEILNEGISNIDDSANLYYNRSCVNLKLDNIANAFLDLEKSVELNLDIIDYLKVDSDFDEYRNNNKYLEILNFYLKK